MEEPSKTLEVLRADVTQYLRKMAYSQSRIQYGSVWQLVAAFMKERGQTEYSASVGEAFIYDLLGERTSDALDRWEKAIIQCTNALTEFMETGTVKFRRSQKFRDLPGAVGQRMQEYIAYKQSYGIARATIGEYQASLQQFLRYLEVQASPPWARSPHTPSSTLRTTWVSAPHLCGIAICPSLKGSSALILKA